MALNEITKGMSNAAEKINQNFLFGSIVESGSNEKGHYVKFGNGIMVCWGTITALNNANTLLPSKYLNASHVVVAVPTTGNTADKRKTFVSASGSSDGAAMYFRLYGDGGVEYPEVLLNYVTIGPWK